MLKRTFEQQPALRILAERPISLSLDVFDTTLIRKCSTRELFRRLGEKAIEEWDDWELSADEFARWRSVSEERANREHVGGRFVLRDIYRHFAKGYPLSKPRIGRLMELELELEAAHLTTVPEMRLRIAQEHANGRAVLFLSDMYLPSNWLCGVLAHHGLWQNGDELFVSGEAKASKSRGDLFSLAEKELGYRLTQPVHCGDNPWSDVSQAEASGWRAELFSTALPTEREAHLASYAPDFGRMPNTLAAAARIARLRMSPANPKELDAHLGCMTSIAAPILVAYTVWVLRQARALGLKRIYFMTRDGIVLKGAFDDLVRKIAADEGIESRLLAASRQVCRQSSIDPDTSVLPDWVTYDPHQITVTSCLFRVGLTPAEFETDLCAIGFTPAKWERPLSKRDVKRLRAFLHQPDVRKVIDAAARVTRETYEQYLTDVGLYDGVPAAIVDIGWRGSTFDSLVKRLPEESRSSLHLFLFGFLGETYNGLNGDAIHSYYCDNWRGQGELGAERLVTLMEDFVAVSHGTLIGVSRDDAGRVQPEFRVVEHCDLARKRLAINKNAPRELIKLLPEAQLESWCVDRMTPVWKHLIDSFWNTPSEAELLEFSEHRREVDQSGHVSVKLATAYSWSELLWWCVGLRPLDAGITCWTAGRRALTTGWRRTLLNRGEWFHSRWPGFSKRVRSHKRRCAALFRRQRNPAHL